MTRWPASYLHIYIYIYISAYLRAGGVRAPGQPGAGPPLPARHRQAAPRQQGGRGLQRGTFLQMMF